MVKRNSRNPYSPTARRQREVSKHVEPAPRWHLVEAFETLCGAPPSGVDLETYGSGRHRRGDIPLDQIRELQPESGTVCQDCRDVQWGMRRRGFQSAPR